jgi:hypothetical protein
MKLYFIALAFIYGAGILAGALVLSDRPPYKVKQLSPCSCEKEGCSTIVTTEPCSCSKKCDPREHRYTRSNPAK